MTMIEKFNKYSGGKKDAESLNTAFKKLGEDVKKERPDKKEWYAFAMTIRCQDWFKDPEQLQYIVEDGHLPEVFCEAMEVVTKHNNEYAMGMFPHLPFFRQNYIKCISAHICDPKKTGRTVRVVYTDPKFPDEYVAVPNGWLKDNDEAMVQTLVILTALRGGIIVFKYDSPIKEKQKVGAFFFGEDSQYPLKPDDMKEKGFIGKNEVGYEAIV